MEHRDVRLRRNATLILALLLIVGAMAVALDIVVQRLLWGF